MLFFYVLTFLCQIKAYKSDVDLYASKINLRVNDLYVLRDCN